MAAPIAGNVQLPIDSGNTGKKVRTQTRVIGADTVHEHYFIPVSADSKTGFYRAHSGTLTVPTAAQNGTTTGHLWLLNPLASTIKIRLRRLREINQAISGAVDLTAARALYSLFTYTGAPSGASITPARRDSTDAVPQASLRTASTGMTVSLGAAIRCSGIPAVNATAASATVQVNLMPAIYPPWDPDEEECPVLRPGEGIVLYSPDASTTANRRLWVDLAWEEFE